MIFLVNVQKSPGITGESKLQDSERKPSDSAFVDDGESDKAAETVVDFDSDESQNEAANSKLNETAERLEEIEERLAKEEDQRLISALLRIEETLPRRKKSISRGLFCFKELMMIFLLKPLRQKKKQTSQFSKYFVRMKSNQPEQSNDWFSWKLSDLKML
jgi:hypothetical protein